MKQLLMQPALWLCVSMISYPDYWCFNKDTTFLHNSTILPHSEKRETALEPFPFQLIFLISSEVCFHHLLPGLVRDGDIGFQGIDNTKRVFPQFCGPQFCGSMVALPGGGGISPFPPNSRTSAPPMGNRNAHPRAPRADIGLWRTAITCSARRTGISVRLFGDGAGDVPKTGTSPAVRPFPFPKLSLSICRTKRKKPYLPKHNQSTS